MMNTTFWQVAAGDGSRDYSKAFIEYGVILVGPGSEGNYFDNPQVYLDKENNCYRDFTITLSEKMQQGDRVVLKRPKGSSWEVLAIGEVISDYIHSEVFSDVDGWDLQHCRQVKWKVPKSPVEVPGLRRGTLCRVKKASALTNITQYWEEWEYRDALDIPMLPDKLQVDELIDLLIVNGLPIRTAEDISDTLWRIRRIAKWYTGFGRDVGEHEIRTFLIIPLLLSLGWAEQRIKIEWNNIDVSLFSGVYQRKSEPEIIIESKRLGDGLRYAPAQAKGYAERYPFVTKFIVTDGIRYKFYERVNDSWIFTSYINLLELYVNHPYEQDVSGAKDFLLKLLP